MPTGRGSTQKGEASIKDVSRLFHDQVILYGFNPVDALGDFNSFIDGFLATGNPAQAGLPRHLK
jgi:hypothetical protein